MALPGPCGATPCPPAAPAALTSSVMPLRRRVLTMKSRARACRAGRSQEGEVGGRGSRHTYAVGLGCFAGQRSFRGLRRSRAQATRHCWHIKPADLRLPACLHARIWLHAHGKHEGRAPAAVQHTSCAPPAWAPAPAAAARWSGPAGRPAQSASGRRQTGRMPGPAGKAPTKRSTRTVRHGVVKTLRPAASSQDIWAESHSVLGSQRRS